MADDRSAAALAAAEKLIKRKPDATTAEFRTVCERADKSIAKLTGRQFNALYVLPTKRRLGFTKSRRKSKATAKAKPRAKRKTRRRSANGRRRGARRRAAGRGRVSGRALARKLVLDRDQQVRDVLVKGSDQQAAYELGANVDAFVDEIAAALKG
jgi:hypothetical protein